MANVFSFSFLAHGYLNGSSDLQVHHQKRLNKGLNYQWNSEGMVVHL